ncbi:MAG: SCO family protein, partial [Pseudomonadales bacterium]
TTLATLRSFKQALAPELLQDTQVVFVSVDPARDTHTQLAQYVEYFDPDFIGVSGEFLELQRFTQQLNTAFNKVPGGGENYLVDHSANIVLINPRGDYQGFIKPPFDLVRLTHAYEQLRLNYQRNYGAG